MADRVESVIRIRCRDVASYVSTRAQFSYSSTPSFSFESTGLLNLEALRKRTAEKTKAASFGLMASSKYQNVET